MVSFTKCIKGVYSTRLSVNAGRHAGRQIGRQAGGQAGRQACGQTRVDDCTKTI